MPISAPEAELLEVRGEGALADGEDLLQFGDGELFLFEEAQDADAAGIGEHAEGFED